MHIDPVPIESLTSREIEVLRLLDVRLSNKEIAAVLRISPGSIERHTRSISRKLVIRTRRAAVARTHELRLLSSRVPEGESPP
jgi:LuxR family transcriptional regulator, maltose regulon positive regulatory protein